jgi:DNA-binding transcriptional LysR family regulator
VALSTPGGSLLGLLQLRYGRPDIVRLYVAQPSLSQQIRALEKELGAELLERGRHGVTLTPAGRILLPQAQRAVQAVQEARDSVRQVVEGRNR